MKTAVCGAVNRERRRLAGESVMGNHKLAGGTPALQVAVPLQLKPAIFSVHPGFDRV